MMERVTGMRDEEHSEEEMTGEANSKAKAVGVNVANGAQDYTHQTLEDNVEGPDGGWGWVVAGAAFTLMVRFL